MEFKDIMASRRSIRKYSDKKIEREVLQQLVDTALLAPSSRNSHSTHFMIVENKEIIEKMSAMRDYGAAFIKNAPALILVMGDTSKTDLTTVNSSISATSLLLAATDLGLSACWVHVEGRAMLQAEAEGKKAEEHLREILTIPAEFSVLCCVAVGYSDFSPAPLPEFDTAAHVSWID